MKPLIRTYSEWMLMFERFSIGDDTVFEEMDSSAFEMDAGAAQRFCSRAEEAYRKRKQGWLDKFQRSFAWQRPAKVEEFGMVLRDGKQNLLPLVKFVTCNGLPEALKKTLYSDLSSSIAEIRRSLKDNILKSRDRNNTEKLLMMVSTLDVVGHHSHKSSVMGNEDKVTASATGRRIIF